MMTHTTGHAPRDAQALPPVPHPSSSITGWEAGLSRVDVEAFLTLLRVTAITIRAALICRSHTPHKFNK